MTLYASSKCLDDCTVTEFPTANDNCYNSESKDIDNLLLKELEDDCIINFGVSL